MTHSKLNLVLLLTIVSSVTLSFPFQATCEEKKKEPTVKDLMLAAHKAPKGKMSPLAHLQSQLKSETPDWQVVNKNTTPLAKLAKAIDGKEFGYRGPTKPYVDAVTLLKQSAAEQDVLKGRKAINAITTSCASCHYGR